jgi:hypothetical protein
MEKRDTKDTKDDMLDCNFKTFFKVGNAVVIVKKNPEEINFDLPLKTREGIFIHYVGLGSDEHLAAIQCRIDELGASSRTEDNQEELYQRYTELYFIEKNVSGSLHDYIRGNQSLFCDREPKNVVNVTSSDLQRELNTKRMYIDKDFDVFFRIPRARQYHLDGIFYREFRERTVASYELFSDLIFAGVIYEAKDVIHYSWSSYIKFILVFSCVYSNWFTLMM